MRRRTFLATLPLAAVGTALEAQVRPGQGRGPAEQGGLPAFQPPNAETYDRPDVHAGDRPAGASFASRSAVYGRSGAVGAAHPLAVQAGIDMLRRGGSAVDAAVAGNACLGFLEPTSSGIGGDVFAMIW